MPAKKVAKKAVKKATRKVAKKVVVKKAVCCETPKKKTGFWSWLMGE